MNKAKVYIKENKERFISELFDLLRIPSISAQSEHKPDMTRCAEWLAAALAKAGADRTEVFPTVLLALPDADLADAAAESSRTRNELALYERPEGESSAEDEE